MDINTLKELVLTADQMQWIAAAYNDSTGIEWVYDDSSCSSYAEDTELRIQLVARFASKPADDFYVISTWKDNGDV